MQEFRKEPAQAETLMDIGIREIYTPDHDMFRESVRKFCQEEIQPQNMKWIEQGHVDASLWENAGAQGMLGTATPAEQGGIGGDVLHSSIIWQELAYVNDSGCGFAMHSDIVMPYISHYGTPEQIEKFIPKMTEGKCIGALAMTEPAAGSDLQGIKTRAVKDGDDYILNGSKVFITNGIMAGVVVVVAITNPKAKSPAHGISLFLVEEGMEGFKKGKRLNKMGLKSQDTAELFFEDVRLPKSALLGQENKGFYYLMEQLPQERLLIGDMGVAACEWMFEETRAYVRDRKAFGKTIADLQVIQHQLAEMKTDICIGRAYMDQCLKVHLERGLDSESASMAKWWLTELQNKVAYRCVQMHGGWGYMWEYPISQAYVNARVQPIYGGANEVMKDLIARNIVKPRK